MLHCQGKLKSRRADTPRRCKRRCTVQANTGHAANMAISWLVVSDVVVQFCKADLTIRLYSRPLVMGGRQDLTFHSVTH